MREYNQSAVGRQIRKYRTSSGISQKKLAELVGVAPSYISELERGGKSKTSSVGIEIICKIADCLGVSIDDLADTNLEYAKKKVIPNDLLGNIEKELYSMSKKDIDFFNKIVPVFVNTFKNKSKK